MKSFSDSKTKIFTDLEKTLQEFVKMKPKIEEVKPFSKKHKYWTKTFGSSVQKVKPNVTPTSPT